MFDLGAWLSSVGTDFEMDRPKRTRCDSDNGSIAGITGLPFQPTPADHEPVAPPSPPPPNKRRWQRLTLVLPLYL